MFGTGEQNLYEVTYSLGDGTKTKTISCPADEGKPGKRKALSKLADPMMMMVPPEDITVKSIKRVKEDSSGNMSYY